MSIRGLSLICNSLLQSAGMTLDGSFLVFDPHFIPYLELTLFMLDEHNDTCCMHSFAGINFETWNPATADVTSKINMLEYAKLFYTFQGETETRPGR